MQGGDDRAGGGRDADTFVLHQGLGNDRIFDFEDEVDTLLIDGSLWAGVLDQARLDALSDTSSGTLVLDFGDGHQLTLNGWLSNDGLLDDITLF